MHELSTALSILRTAVAVAKRRGADRVEEIDVKVGKLACIDARQLAFAFGIASRGTIAEGAKLRIVEEEARVRCPECGYEGGMEYKGPAHHDFQAMASPTLKCPVRGGETDVLGGRDIVVESIKVRVSRDLSS